MKPISKKAILFAFAAIITVFAAFGAGVWYSKNYLPEPASEQEENSPEPDKQTEGKNTVPITEPAAGSGPDSKIIAETDPEAKSGIRPEIASRTMAEEANKIETDSGANAVPRGWKIYKNDKYGFEFSYPDIYSEKSDPNAKSDKTMELAAFFSRGEAGYLDVKIFNDYFKNYKLNDPPGGFVWCFDAVKKMWVSCGTGEPAGKFGPQKAQGDKESYIYDSGDITCAWKDIIIPHPTYAYVLQIRNTTCGISDEATHGYKQPVYKLDSQEFINKFKFTE